MYTSFKNNPIKSTKLRGRSLFLRHTWTCMSYQQRFRRLGTPSPNNHMVNNLLFGHHLARYGPITSKFGLQVEYLVLYHIFEKQVNFSKVGQVRVILVKYVNVDSSLWIFMAWGCLLVFQGPNINTEALTARHFQFSPLIKNGRHSPRIPKYQGPG